MKKLAILGGAGLIFGFVLGVVLLKITPIPGTHTDVGVVAMAIIGLAGSVKSKNYYTLLSGSSIGCCSTVLYALGISTVAGYIIFGVLCITLIMTMIRMMIQSMEKSLP
jgi:hypothetical protein